MFYSLLYLMTIVAILVFTGLAIYAIIRERPVFKWLAGLTAVSVAYVLIIAISVFL
ncbi:hypothetical protein CLV97_11186 [Planifilum fimeticola]|uniref:Uncharacterized protein n=1 Tax=Planifilum fimeticola TaxID=201975 RepID=A0A2T0LF07_9BACL|nr:hypothetical protein [Planifilum fimeticola]PRX40737.1 hypothetical protein CLV97_11186 [Planifilum fimeticola]